VAGPCVVKEGIRPRFNDPAYPVEGRFVKVG